MPADRTAALLEGYEHQQVESAIAGEKDLVISRTQAAGKSIWRDIWLFPLIMLLIDASITSFYISRLTWDNLILGPIGLTLFGGIMAAMGLAAWLRAGSISIKVSSDELTYRGTSYAISQLCLPRLVPHATMIIRRLDGDELRLFGEGVALSRKTAARIPEIADRLNTAIQLHERRAAFRKTASPGEDPFRDGSNRTEGS